MTTSNGSCGFVSEKMPSDSVRGHFVFLGVKYQKKPAEMTGIEGICMQDLRNFFVR